jgi:hypothetical protein
VIKVVSQVSGKEMDNGAQKIRLLCVRTKIKLDVKQKQKQTLKCLKT